MRHLIDSWQFWIALLIIFALVFWPWPKQKQQKTMGLDELQKSKQYLLDAEQGAEVEKEESLRFLNGIRSALMNSRLSLGSAIQQNLPITENDMTDILARQYALDILLHKWHLEAETARKKRLEDLSM